MIDTEITLIHGAFKVITIRDVCRIIVFFLFTIILSTQTYATESSGSRALLNLNFDARIGDKFVITQSLVENGQKEPFQLKFEYQFVPPSPGEQHAIQLKILSGGVASNKKTSQKFGKLIKAMIPPMRLALDENFQPLSVTNWIAAKQHMKDATAALPERAQAAARIVMLMFPYAQSPESLMGLVRPIFEMHPSQFQPDGDGVTMNVVRTNGGADVTGKRYITSPEVSGDELRASMKTKYDASRLISDNKFLKLLAKSNPSADMESIGNITFDLKSGYMSKMEEVISFKFTFDGREPMFRKQTITTQQELIPAP